MIAEQAAEIARLEAALSQARSSFQQFRSQLAVSENHLAMLYEQNGEPREAEARYR